MCIIFIFVCIIIIILITIEPVGTQVGFEETQLGVIQSSGETRGNQVVPDIMVMKLIIVMMMMMIMMMLMAMMPTSASAG